MLRKPFCSAVAAGSATARSLFTAARSTVSAAFLGPRGLCQPNNYSSTRTLCLNSRFLHPVSYRPTTNAGGAHDPTHPHVRGVASRRDGKSYFPPMDTGFVRQGGQHGSGRRGADEGKQQFRKHDHYQDTSPRKWSSKRRSDRASSLRTFFSHRDAWVNFYDELAAGLSGETPPAQLEKSFGLMMQNYCYTSAQVRDLLDLMHRTSGKTGLKPSAIVYTILISQLQIEGDVDAARAVLHVEMKDKGIPVDDAVMDTLDIDYDGICRRRNSTIKKMLESGLEGRQAAEKLYTTLENQGRVDARVLGSMMHLPLDSDGQRALLERAMTNGTIPNVVAWSILAKQLMIEGDTKAARTVANVEMWSNAGLRK